MCVCMALDGETKAPSVEKKTTHDAKTTLDTRNTTVS